MSVESRAETGPIRRSRSDAFAVCLSLFIALNCGSYFLRGSGDNLFDDRGELQDAIGFPFLVLAVGGPCFRVFRFWSGLFPDLVVVSAACGFVVTRCTEWWPFLLKPHAADRIQYSLRSMLVTVACVAVILGLSRLRPSLQLLVFDLLRFAGPWGIGIAWVMLRRLSLLWLALAGIGLWALATFIALPFDSPATLSLDKSLQTALRAFVPIAGITSGFVLTAALFRTLRFMDEMRPSREEVESRGQ